MGEQGKLVVVDPVAGRPGTGLGITNRRHHAPVARGDDVAATQIAQCQRDHRGQIKADARGVGLQVKAQQVFDCRLPTSAAAAQ